MKTFLQMEIVKCTIWLLGYLVPPQWERNRLLAVLRNISENIVGENHYWNK